MHYLHRLKAIKTVVFRTICTFASSGEYLKIPMAPPPFRNLLSIVLYWGSHVGIYSLCRSTVELGIRPSVLKEKTFKVPHESIVNVCVD